MKKQERRRLIRETILTGRITSQDTLRMRLARLGCRVTQATLSRDLKDLGIARVPGEDGGRYVLQTEGEVRSLAPIVGFEVVSIMANEQMVLIHTLPGTASTVAEYIDVLRQPDVLGTLAGDNTVLVIPRSVRRTRAVQKFLKHSLTGGGTSTP